MLAIEVEYLTGRAVATDYGERSEAEWPPHPQRLFSALVAMHAESDVGAEGALALRWLEQQPPPSICVDLHPGKRQSLSFWVPINDETLSGKGFNLQHLLDRRTKQERYFPSVLPGDTCVTFVWPGAEPTPSERAALAQLVSRLSYLGHSSSMIRACVRADAAAVTLAPHELGSFELRVPGPGRFDRLAQVHHLRVHDETIQPPLGRIQRYVETDTQHPRGDFLHAFTLAFDQGKRFGLAQMAGVTDRLRRALLSKLPELQPEVLSGHAADGTPGTQPHLAIVPLAFVGARHASGELKGLALLLPKIADQAICAMLEEALDKIQQLHFGNLGSLDLRRLDDPRLELQSLRFSRYQTLAKSWVSVTPVIFERFPKPKLSAEQIIVDSLARQNLPAPVAIEIQRMPMLVGSENSAAFNMPEPLRGKLRAHVRLVFERPINGPLLLGSGRFQGFGLFTPDSVR